MPSSKMANIPLNIELEEINEFVRVYYDILDNRRQHSAQMYTNNTTFCWNGLGMNGIDSIKRFFYELPSSQHRVITMDAHPMLQAPMCNARTYHVMTGGTVKFADEALENFQQTFLLTENVDKWLIASDCYRLQ